MQSFKLGKEPTQRGGGERPSKPGAPLGTGHAQCCHLLNLHIPEGTKHSGAAAPASWLSGGHCAVTALGLALHKALSLQGRKSSVQGAPQNLRQEISSSVSCPVPPHPLQKESSQNNSSYRVRERGNICFRWVY